jgi:holo-[acyl-carrier protein] synthase
VDLVQVDDVRGSAEEFGSRYLARVFTPHELGCCPGDAAHAAPGLAARFAAKEATIKVLRVTGAQPEWRSMEVWRHEGGWCEMRLSGEAARLAEEARIKDMAVSLSHEGGIAAAIVVAICEPAEEPADGGQDLGDSDYPGEVATGRRRAG